ncbi:hypothetical protein NC656_14470 [Pseudomonas asiatica]|jgi:hypothetical protein|uniref:Uncharacterized protein n=1 Tax=Pseudomonas asiatica TaxID=2219225 RepID=A0AAJ5HZZ1_9PSED|nr:MULTISPECIES: hypothetical protein [Pseudomonas]MCG3645606.1 hypothetical protein [Pseudomonas putida]MCV6226746.1 hypothetical protein [Pseudomonas aeruginosa]MCO8262753.1 hypothetical protein [Pseudomonas asiatica]MCV6392666.1 hypothetical protein [Pseudomonas aeruginosa]TFW23065.1 hypothetical protein E4L40_13825 [Pseudomonas putida]
MSSKQAPPRHHIQRPLFRDCYSTVIRAVDARYDVRGYLLAELVKLCLKNRATIPPARRRYYECNVQEQAITYLEQCTSRLLFGPNGRFSPDEYRYSQY